MVYIFFYSYLLHIAVCSIVRNNSNFDLFIFKRPHDPHSIKWLSKEQVLLVHEYPHLLCSWYYIQQFGDLFFLRLDLFHFSNNIENLLY